MIALYFLAWSVIAISVCFTYYVLVMELHEHFGMTWWVKLLGWLFVIFVDAPVNIIFLSVWFLEVPKEFLVTARLKRWRAQYGQYKYTNLHRMAQKRLLFAVYVCDRHLDHYDSITGNHC